MHLDMRALTPSAAQHVQQKLCQMMTAARDAGADLLVAGSAVFWSDDPGSAYAELVEVAHG